MSWILWNKVLLLLLMHHTRTTSNKQISFNTFLANIKMETHGKAHKWLNFSFKIAFMVRQKYVTNTEANWFLIVHIIRALWGLQDRADGKGLIIRLDDLTSILGTHMVEGKNVLSKLLLALYTCHENSARICT